MVIRYIKNPPKQKEDFYAVNFRINSLSNLIPLVICSGEAYPYDKRMYRSDSSS